jgi:hypothetical protein
MTTVQLSDGSGQALTGSCTMDLLNARRPTVNWTTVWSTVSATFLPQHVRASWFLAVHNKILTKANLERARLADGDL